MLHRRLRYAAISLLAPTSWAREHRHKNGVFDGLLVGIEFPARPFAEPTLFKFAYAYEQGTRHRKPPASTPARRGEP